MEENPTLSDSLDDVQRIARDQVAAAWQIHIDHLQEMLHAGWRDQIERIFDERFADIRAAVTDEVNRMSATRAAAEAERARHEAVEGLNRAIRRLRVFESEGQWCAALLESAVERCRRAALFSIGAKTFRFIGERGPDGVMKDAPVPGEIGLNAAAAIQSAVETCDTTVAMQTAGEISEAVASYLGGDADQKVYLFPLYTRQRVVAVLYAEQPSDIAGLELLAGVAAATLEGHLAAADTRPSSVVAITGATTPAGPAPAWSALSKEEQDLHLRAQRFARVRVAEMRLYESHAVKTGRAELNLYEKLRKGIDSAREEFREKFLKASPTMVDYLHVELVRTLANDDAAMLGPDYPGPMV